MSHSPASAKISHLRQRSMVVTLEAVLVLFGALLAIAILPTLLLRYFYDTTTLMESPVALEYIPVVAFVLATIYFLRALIGNMRREKQISQLMTEMENDDCCGGACHSDHAEESDEDWDEDLQELEELLAEVEAEEKSEKKSAKKASKPAKAAKVAKTAKKASKK